MRSFVILWAIWAYHRLGLMGLIPLVIYLAPILGPRLSRRA
jgi:hypothetical protein